MPIAQILTDHRPTFDQCANNSIWWYFHKLTSSTKRELYKSKMFSSCKMANNLFAASNPCSFLLCLKLMAEMICQKCNQGWLLQWCIWKLCGGRESQSAKPRRKPRPQLVLSLALALLRTRHRTHLFRIKSTLDCRSHRDKIFSSSSSFLLSSSTPRGMF